MAKTHKLKDENYWDSSSVKHNRQPLSDFLIGQKIEITKSIGPMTQNTWYDTGIIGTDLTTGTYVMEVYLSDYWNSNGQYSERMSGIVAWYAENSNSTNTDEISLSKAGHARNNHDIKLRIARQGNRVPIKLQIMDTLNWNSAANVIFRFRKLI